LFVLLLKNELGDYQSQCRAPRLWRS